MSMYYVAEGFSRARKTWLGQTVGGKTWVDTDSEQVALGAFFNEMMNKKGDYRLQSVVVFPDGSNSRKTVCAIRKS